MIGAEEIENKKILEALLLEKNEGASPLQEKSFGGPSSGEITFQRGNCGEKIHFQFYFAPAPSDY